MKKKNELLRELNEMIKETKANRLKWDIKCSTTEYNEECKKPEVQEDGITWTVDECYVSYHCEFHGQEFLLITYEMIHTSGEQRHTTNLVFLPPLGIRYFDINTLMNYAVEADQMLIYQIHMLWLLILEKCKEDSNQIKLDVDERQLVIE